MSKQATSADVVLVGEREQGAVLFLAGEVIYQEVLPNG